jgi:2-oxoglutarate dehydrogenase E1 component
MTIDLERHAFLTGTDSAFIERLYANYLADPKSVDPSWQAVFSEFGDTASAIQAETDGAPWKRRDLFAEPKASSVPAPAAGPVLDDRRATIDSIRALMMIRAYRVRGHLIARLDPLDLEAREYHPELDPRSYGFTDEDLDREIFIDHVLGLESATLREIVAVLRHTYCSTIGYEFMHISHAEDKQWIQQRIEGAEFHERISASRKRKIINQLTRAEGFEQFLHRKYPGTKRFGLDGGESLIPLLEAIIKRAAQVGVHEVLIGMPHRGRLNVLANILEKPYAQIFGEFQGVMTHPDDWQGSGDVKYHLGTSSERILDDMPIYVSLSPNPSHLEAVDPVVIGRTRAKQFLRGDDDRKEVMAVLMHGDAAFAGQGIVAETFGLSELRGYKTGGTIHIIVNNQIGFTTSPSFSRSSPYPSDIAKAVQAPIFHVNGDDPEAVVTVARIATEFRQKFGRDVVIDMFCYRRHGHNEGDEPKFTQPLMYRKIAEHPTTRELYAWKLVTDGEMAQDEVDGLAEEFRGHLDHQFDVAANYKANRAMWFEGRWKGVGKAHGEVRRGRTAVGERRLKQVGAALTRVPDGFVLHPTIRRLLDAKKKIFDSGEGIDWGTAEALAFGTLLQEGHHVRLSGQDCGRGTFSHRHAVLVHQETEERHVPLNNICEGQGQFEVIDSMLSEMAVLGFEYGYSLTDPNVLVMWEAQFGDFANGAQVIVDQFLAPGEMKWMRMSGLVMLLPHGQEGQGPEHSSARLERYLQLCAEDNLQVVQPTSPFNYFHLLRRQIHRDFRKPLIVMTPKSLLRHKLCVSSLKEFEHGDSFHRVLWDRGDVAPDDKIKRVVLCSGKVYYDLFEEREKRGIRDVYLLRIEQLYPFPVRAVSKELSRFPKADIVWCQEEPQNMGAWSFVEPRIERILEDIRHKKQRAAYAGRKEMAAPAPGTMALHNEQQGALVNEALTV